MPSAVFGILATGVAAPRSFVAVSAISMRDSGWDTAICPVQTPLSLTTPLCQACPSLAIIPCRLTPNVMDAALKLRGGKGAGKKLVP